MKLKAKPRKRIFICSPYAQRGRHTVEDNVDLAKQLCLLVARAGHAPYAPHLLFPQFLDDVVPADRDLSISSGLAWLGQADEVWVYGVNSDDCSAGMQREVDAAMTFYIPPQVVWMPNEFLAANWKTSGLPEQKVKPICLFCQGTGRILEDHAGAAGYRDCGECAA